VWDDTVLCGKEEMPTWQLFRLVLVFTLSCVGLGSKCSRLRSLHEYEDKIYSQNGEDGVLLALLDALSQSKEEGGYYVEFGASDGVECNSRILRERLHFTGLSMDGGFSDPSIGLHQEFVTERNVLSLFAKYQVPSSFDVLSIDVDMFDYWILVRLLRDGTYRPNVIIVETNPMLCMDDSVPFRQEYAFINAQPLVVVHPDMTNQTTWDLSRYAGANPKAFQMLAAHYGYDMVYCERCGVNCFLVLRSALPADCQDHFVDRMPLVPYPCYTSNLNNKSPGHGVDPLHRQVIRVDEALLANITALTLPTGDNDFRGRDVSERNLYSCSANTKGWGQDWCEFLIPSPFDSSKSKQQKHHHRDQQQEQQQEQEPTSIHGDTEQVDEPSSVAAAAAFRQGDYKLASDSFLAAAEYAKVDCKSKHRSERACQASAASYFNHAIALLHLGPIFGTQALAALTKAQEMDPRHPRILAVLSFVDSVLSPMFLHSLLTGWAKEVFRFTNERGELAVAVSLGAGACDNIAQRATALCHKLGLATKECQAVEDTMRASVKKNVFSNSPFDLSALLHDDLRFSSFSTSSASILSSSSMPPCLASLLVAIWKKDLHGFCAEKIRRNKATVLVFGPPSRSISLVTKFLHHISGGGGDDEYVTQELSREMLLVSGCSQDQVERLTKRRLLFHTESAEASIDETLLACTASASALSLFVDEASQTIPGASMSQKVYHHRHALLEGRQVVVHGEAEISLTHSVWSEPLASHSSKLASVFIVANPSDSACYQHLQQGISLATGLALWLAYVNAALAALQQSTENIIVLELQLAAERKDVSDVPSSLLRTLDSVFRTSLSSTFSSSSTLAAEDLFWSVYQSQEQETTKTTCPSIELDARYVDCYQRLQQVVKGETALPLSC